MKRIFTFLIVFIGLMSVMQAQVDEVTLVVSGEGVTKDEAVTKALRSAIEQAFGVFVSANTEILNDKLVKDEIATVSSGNIKSYKELGLISKSDGKTVVSLQATVSLKKLTSYAKGHGSSCEFAGATFAANMKLVELNKENTKKAFANLYKQIEATGNDLYTCEITTKNIRQDGLVQLSLTYYTNETAVALGELIKSTLEALSIPENVVQTLTQQGVELYSTKLVYSRNMVEQLVYYYPLELPTVMGRLYDVYDNLGNKYDMFFIDNQGHISSPTRTHTIKITNKETYNALYKEWEKYHIYNPPKWIMVKSILERGEDYWEKRSWEGCEIKIFPCDLSLEEWLLAPERNYIQTIHHMEAIVPYAEQALKGYIIMQHKEKYGKAEGVGIPKAYLDQQPVNLIGKKKKSAKFVPQHLFDVDVWISIPTERLGQITNLYVK